MLVHRRGRGELLTQVNVDARCRGGGGHRRQHVLLVQLLLLLLVPMPIDVRRRQENRLHGQKAVRRDAVGLGGSLKVGGVDPGRERGHETGCRVVRVLGRVADCGGGHVAGRGDGGGGDTGGRHRVDGRNYGGYEVQALALLGPAMQGERVLENHHIISTQLIKNFFRSLSRH